MRGFWVTLIAGALALAAAAPAAAAIPVNEVSPAITGKARVGQTLAASQGEWTGAPTAFFYQWLRCDSTGANCAPVAAATEPNYALTAADLGARIRVEVVATNADGASPARRSAATGVVKVPAPTLLARPTLAGVPREGETLSSTPGQWTGNPTSYEYEWKRCVAGQCVTVAGAAAPTYPLGGADVGARIRVRVAARNDGGRSPRVGSNTTPTIMPAAEGFALGRPSFDRRRGLARFRVSVPSAGVLTLKRTAKVRGATISSAASRVAKLTVRPRRAAARKLNRRGRVRVRVKVTFAPTVGAARQETRRIQLRKR